MKRLSWMMCISCLLPVVMIMPTQASSFAAEGVNPTPNIGEPKLLVQDPAPAPPEPSAKPANDGVRRFLRSATPCNCGGAAERANLDKAKAEATAFLESIKNPNANQLGKPTPASGASFPGPTW